jgi:hypothetical protein
MTKRPTAFDSEELGRAIGTLLRETKSDMAKTLDDRLKNLDGAALLKTVLGSMLSSNLAAVEKYLDDMTLRQAIVVSETGLSPVITKAIDK